jgi:hypothetical protein
MASGRLHLQLFGEMRQRSLPVSVKIDIFLYLFISFCVYAIKSCHQDRSGWFLWGI